jgi:hypothetical protein
MVLGVALAYSVLFRKRPANESLSYTEDVFFGVRWRWRYVDGSGVSLLGAYCPKCDLEMQPMVPQHQFIGPYVFFRCEDCGEAVAQIPAQSMRELEDRIRRTIQKNLRARSRSLAEALDL